MILRIEQDHNRFKQIIRGRIKKDLKKYISSGELIGRRGKDFISIPLPQIRIPQFIYGPKQTGGVGQGEGAIGTTNLQSKVAIDASQMYSRNMEKLVVHLLGDGALKIDLAEEITQGCVITHGGNVVHPRVNELVTAKGAA